MTQIPQPELSYTEITYIYALVDPISGSIRYVGKSDNPEYRYNRHIGPIESSANTHKARWIRDLMRAGKHPLLKIISCCPRSEWEKREMFWISHFRENGCDLTNETPGGDGRKAGFRHKPDSVSKIVTALIGRPVSEETREKIRNSNIQRVRERVIAIGENFTPEHRGKISESNKSAWSMLSPENRDEKLKNLRHGWTEESRASLSKSHIQLPKRAGLTSQYKGVYWFKRDSCWRAWLWVSGKHIHLGYFQDEAEAAIAYDKAARIYRPEAAVYNFPEEAHAAYVKAAKELHGEFASY